MTKREQQLADYRREAGQHVRQWIEGQCSDDNAIRTLASRVLPDHEVWGTESECKECGAPTVVEVVEKLVNIIQPKERDGV